MKTLVIVPAYNEEANIEGVINDLRTYCPEADIVVIDDGSKDKTSLIVKRLGVNALILPFNLGIGGAMQAGYRYAKLKKYDIAIQFDGDGQHMASEIKKIVMPLTTDTADIVIGSRFLEQADYRSPFFRRLGISFFSSLLSLILGMKITDTTSGFRAVNKKVISFFSDTYPDDYPEVEALVLLHKEKFRIMETSVSMRQRKGGKSSITALRSVYYMVKVFLAVMIDIFKKRTKNGHT